ncbi:Zn(2)-C6 fungal-type domain-containing protein [Fusarium sp. LHS14.1]|nr:Zn(2)-C6 fungal-type domain-containing protein [Fusarium sp. LHS14.1]
MDATASIPGWESPHTSAAEVQPLRKRLRVRKGTKSCWECKRRKIRCTFATSADMRCTGCKRRRTACVGQEFPDESMTFRSTDGDGSPAYRDRLGRLEASVEMLVKISGPNGHNTSDPGSPSRVTLQDETVSADTLPQTSATTSGAPECTSPNLPVREVAVTGKLDEISRALAATWPKPHELEIILSEPLSDGTSFLEILHKLGYIPNTPSNKGSPLQGAPLIPQPRAMLQLPPPGSHPVLIAKKIFLLGLYSQNIQSHAKYYDTMSHMVEAAISLVATRDELTSTLEGIECISLECLYHEAAGNLRRSWLAIRRAVALCQVMNLHRGSATSLSLEVLEPETRQSGDPEHMWFRVVQMDRHISMMLGLPHYSPESVLTHPESMERCTPVERMRRLDAVAGGRILARNQGDIADGVAETREIDQLLRNSSEIMPPQWWLSGSEATTYTSNPGEQEGEEIRILEATIRISDQLIHYQLLVQLHFPYLLSSSAQSKYNYSKMTAVHASRELLRRFLAFRVIYPVSSYCHGLEFSTFIAISALCLAHMEARRQVLAENVAIRSSVLCFLTHQRQADRGMMERAVENMERMATARNNVLVKKAITILRHLLVIEADVAAGGWYSVDSSPAETHDSEEQFGRLSEDCNVLDIFIPYFGTVKIHCSRSDTFISPPMPPRSEGQNEHAESCTRGATRRAIHPAIFSLNKDSQETQITMPEFETAVGDWTLQGIDSSFFDNLAGTGAGMLEARP